MSISHRSNRLKLVGSPSVEQLQNGRYRLSFNCVPLNPRNDWFFANKDRIFAAYGSAQNAAFTIDGLSARTGELYDDMALVNVSLSGGESPVLSLVYETLSSSFVQTKDDTIDHELNGLRRVTRESIAQAGTDFQKTVGTTSITSQIDTESAVTCILSSYRVDDTDSYRKVTETYIQAGTVSRTEDFVGSQDSLVLETIGADPSTPAGFSLASKQESNFEGYQTNRFTFLKNDVKLSESEDKVGSELAISQQWFNPATDKTLSGYSLASKNTSDFEGIKTVEFRFLKDNVLLSESEDKVGSQLAIVKEVFNGTRSAPSGYSLANEQESNVDGIPTRRFTFLKNNVLLSESEDKVGSQLAIVKEVFNGTRSAPSGYTLANEQKSDVDGIPTRRFTFLKNSVLSLQQDFNNGIKRVSAQAFNLTSSQVISALSEITSNHLLVSESESDFQGIPTRTFVYELNLSDAIDYELNGLKRVTRTELSTNDFSEQSIGAAHPSLSGLFIASQNIDNGGVVKRRVTVSIQAGTISKTENNGPAGLPNTFIRTVVSSGTEPTSLGITLSEQQRNVNGYKEFTYRFLEGVTEGSSPDMNSLVEYETVLDVRKPGIIAASKTGSTNAETALLSVTPPSIGKVKALVKVELTTSNHVEIPTALNLDGVSAAAETTVTKTTPIGIDQGSNLSVRVFNTRKNTSRQSFPNHYKSGADVTATFTSASQVIKDGDNIIGETSDESTVTVITLTGSSTAPSTKGLYSQEIDPVFIDASGKQHYRRTSFILI